MMLWEIKSAVRLALCLKKPEWLREMGAKNCRQRKNSKTQG